MAAVPPVAIPIIPGFDNQFYINFLFENRIYILRKVCNIVMSVVLYLFWNSIESYEKVSLYYHAFFFVFAWYTRTRDRNVSIHLITSPMFVITFVSVYTFSYMHMVFSCILMLGLAEFEPFTNFQRYMFVKTCLDFILTAGKLNLIKLLHSGPFNVPSNATNILSACVFIFCIWFDPNPDVPRRSEDVVVIAAILTPILVFALLIIISHLI